MADDPDLAEVLTEFDAYIGELFISVDKAHEQAQEYGHHLSVRWAFGSTWLLHINGYDHYTPKKKRDV